MSHLNPAVPVSEMPTSVNVSRSVPYIDLEIPDRPQYYWPSAKLPIPYHPTYARFFLFPPIHLRIPDGNPDIPSDFLSLPTELQLAILRYIIPRPDNAITVQSHDFNRKCILDLAWCCRKLHDLAYTIYYGENTFSFAKHHVHNHFRPDRRADAFLFPNPTVCRYLRNVELYIRIRRTPGNVHCLLDDPGMDDLRVLMRPTVSFSGHMHSDIAKETAWQEHIRNLNTLKLSITMESFTSHLRTRQLMEGLATTVSIPIKPRALELEMKTPKLSWGDGRRCDEVFESVVKGMVELRTDH
jgi:hypothetical protein